MLYVNATTTYCTEIYVPTTKTTNEKINDDAKERRKRHATKTDEVRITTRRKNGARGRSGRKGRGKKETPEPAPRIDDDETYRLRSTVSSSRLSSPRTNRCSSNLTRRWSFTASYRYRRRRKRKARNQPKAPQLETRAILPPSYSAFRCSEWPFTVIVVKARRQRRLLIRPFLLIVLGSL
jgi:hypothetical protein